MTKRSETGRRREQERLRVEVVELRAQLDRLSLLAAQVPELARERDHYSERARVHHARADALAAECADLRRQLAHERDRCPQCGARRVGRWPAGERCPDCRHFDDPALDDPTTETSR